MIYQVRANLFFTNEGIARGLYNHIEGIFPNATLVNPGQPEQEHSIIELIENHHDEDPNAACSMIDEKDNLPD